MIGRLLALACLLAAASGSSAQPVPAGGNPIAPHIYAADPAPHVWPNDPDTLWVYASHDEPGASNHDSMKSYHVFSTQDLVSWTDHGQILSLANVPWATQQAWAVDAVFWKGKYYLVFCMKDKVSGVFMTALATSDRPEGPFTPLGQIKGTEWGQDPAIFVDDDGAPYLYWGHDSLLYAAKLAPDLLSIIPETKVELTKQLPSVFEAPWVNHINGKYVLSYAGLPKGAWPERLYSAIGDKPLGPFHDEAVFMETFPQGALTNHGGLVKFKGRWIYLYHSAWGSGGQSYDRSLMGDAAQFDRLGRIATLVPTKPGLGGGKTTTSRIWLEAENGSAAGGQLTAVDVKSDQSGYSGRGYVSGFPVRPENSDAFYAVKDVCPKCIARVSPGQAKVLAEVARDQDYMLSIRYSAAQDTRIITTVGVNIVKGTLPNGDLAIPKTEAGRFVTYQLGKVHLKAGDNVISFQTRDQKDLLLDAFELVPVQD